MFVYLVTNLTNNKYYVGKTIGSLNHRWKNHCADAKRRDDTSSFHAAIRKYGPETFDIQILSTGSSDKQIKNLEKVWIILLQSKTKGIGYNLTSGGDGLEGYKHSIENNRLSSERLKKRLENTSFAELIAKTQFKKGIVPWNKNKALKTHCPANHILSEDNLIKRKNCTHRACLTCHRERQRKYISRLKEAILCESVLK